VHDVEQPGRGARRRGQRRRWSGQAAARVVLVDRERPDGELDRAIHDQRDAALRRDAEPAQPRRQPAGPRGERSEREALRAAHNRQGVRPSFGLLAVEFVDRHRSSVLVRV